MLLESGVLVPVKIVDLNREEDEHLGTIQILRRELPYPHDRALEGGLQKWCQQWVSALPAILDRLNGHTEPKNVAVAAALIESNWGDDTPFERFVANLLDEADTRPVTFDDVRHLLLDSQDGNMRDDWARLVRSDRRMKADFPNGVPEMKEAAHA